jgi:hypothetical protein
MSDAEAQVVSYLRAWNERDAERRRAWVARTWTEDGTYTDPEGGGTGHAGIDALILQTQRQRPRCRLRLVGPVAARGDCVRFRWAGEGDPAISGTVFALRGGDGRFEAVAVFRP